MFENAQWIALADAHGAPWFFKPFENEDVPSWLDDPAYAHQENGSVVFKKTFSITKKAEKAMLSICGLGFYEVWINGRKPDDKRMLTPYVSDYNRYVRYDTYDVTPLLKDGLNLIAVEVCGGWFTGRQKFWGWQQIFFGNPRLIAELDVVYTDRTTVSVVTEPDTWKVRHGAIVRSCVYDGEVTDFSLLPKDWMKTEINDGTWQLPVLADAPNGVMQNDTTPPVRIVKEYSPVKSWKLSDTDTVYDFGVNGTAIPQFAAQGRKGDTVTLHYSEYINEDGTLKELSCQGGGSDNTDIFVLSGDGGDFCQPRFTWHGYRYCRVTCSDAAVSVSAMKKLELHSDLAAVGTFECSNENFNRLHRAYVQTQISCLVGGPVDCSQRGERKGWLGDAGVSAEEAIYNFDMRELYKNFLADCRAERHPQRKTFGIICPNHKSVFDGTSIDWAIAFPIILTESYGRYGDRELLLENKEALYDYIGYYISIREPDGMLPVSYTDTYSGKTVSPAWFGDWCTDDYYPGTERVAFDCGSDEHRQNPTFLGSIFFMWLLRLGAQVAQTLGDTETAERYLSMREEARAAVCAKYYHADTHTLGSGGQFLQTIALWEHVVPECDRDAVFAVLLSAFEEKDRHCGFGIFGQRMIGDVLRSFGREDYLYALMNTPGYPGFLHMIEKGQTTIAEHLTGHDDDVWGSGCHCMFASPDANFHRIFGGITVNRFDAVPVTIAPYAPADMTFAADTQTLAEGVVSVRWERRNGGIVYTVAVPAGLSAKLRLSDGETVFERTVSGGHYCFVLRCGQCSVL